METLLRSLVKDSVTVYIFIDFQAMTRKTLFMMLDCELVTERKHNPSNID